MGHMYIPESLASYPISIHITTGYLAASCTTCKGLQHRLGVMVKDLIPALFICSCYFKDTNNYSTFQFFKMKDVPQKKIKITLSMKLSIRAPKILV